MGGLFPEWVAVAGLVLFLAALIGYVLAAVIEHHRDGRRGDRED